MSPVGFGGGLYSQNSVASHGNKTQHTSNAGHMNPKLADVSSPIRRQQNVDVLNNKTVDVNRTRLERIRNALEA